jgi:hypothetical protein
MLYSCTGYEQTAPSPDDHNPRHREQAKAGQAFIIVGAHLLFVIRGGDGPL